MKKYVLRLSFALILLLIASFAFYIIVMNPRSNHLQDSKNITMSLKNNKPIEDKDFIVTDPIDTITLDMPYKSFKTTKPEIKQDNNFVGDITSGEFVYKYYFHEYKDFTIYVSNANYNLKNRSIDDRYITQITIKNSSFKTARGIAVGQTSTEIVNAYGEGKKVKENDNYTLLYQYKDKALTFVIDKENKVTAIILNIVVKK